MVEPHKSTHKCYVTLTVTVIFALVLYMLIPLVRNKLERDSDCRREDDDVTDQSKHNQSLVHDVTEQDKENQSLIYDVSNGIHVTQLVDTRDTIVTSEVCSWRHYAAYLLWLPVAGVMLLWLLIVLCVVCVNHPALECGSYQPVHADQSDSSRKSFRTLRARIHDIKLSRLRAELHKHSMLQRVKLRSSSDGRRAYQTLYKYLRELEERSGTQQVLGRRKTYRIEQRRVYKINNDSLWEQFNGDRRELVDIVEELAGLHGVALDTEHDEHDSDQPSHDHDIELQGLHTGISTCLYMYIRLAWSS